MSRSLRRVGQQVFDHQVFGPLLLTRGSGWKGRGLGQDLVLVGHEGRKAKSLDVLGWVCKFRGEILNQSHLSGDGFNVGRNRSSPKKAKSISPRPSEVQPGSVWQAPATGENEDNDVE